jgi:anti-anti-sigma regulatory factor
MAHDVFVSYASSDKAMADAVCATLESRRIRCWIAPRDVLPGADYAGSLIDAISLSRVFVLVLSSSSNQSPHVMREVERAVTKAIPIIPLRIENVTLTKAMEYYLSTPHWLDALTPPLENHLRRLADTVTKILVLGVSDTAPAKPQAEPAPTMPAEKPTADLSGGLREAIVLDACVIRPGQLLTPAQCGTLKRLFRQRIDDGYRLFVLDMGDTTTVNSMSAGTIVSFGTILRMRMGKFVLAGMGKGIHEWLAITKLGVLFEKYDTVELALSQLLDKPIGLLPHFEYVERADEHR